MPPLFRHSSGPVLTPQAGVPWADTMLLNPAIITDPVSPRLHMLFRATGPWPQARRAGLPLPYPIFLGYATSDDDGITWQADWSRPALTPRLGDTPGKIQITGPHGRALVNHANGCVEDPRLCWLEGRLLLTVACRMFPPGPYWEHDEPMQCAPAWARDPAHGLGRAATENLTVTVLYEVNLPRLAARDYDLAFRYLTHLSDPARGDNRDVFFFPEKLRIGGRDRYALLHRPFEPASYQAPSGTPPCIFVAAADRIEDLPTARAEHRLLARSEFVWEGNRVGASWPPLSLGDGAWLVPYHGKQDAVVGYTQSFLITRPDESGWPVVAHRCPDRLLFASEPWHLQGRFKTPCVFTCAGIRRGADLVMSYGAADTTAGIVRVDFAELVSHVRRYDAHGRRL
jgi:predicted GH43/DUF377 family glycosyl hydrolase